MLSNSISLHKEYEKNINEIDIYKDTVKKILKIEKDINELKKINNVSKKNVISLDNQKILKNLEHSYKDSLILLNIIKHEIEKSLLKKYDIEKTNDLIKKIKKDNIIQDKTENKVFTNENYKNIINNEKNQDILMKKKILNQFELNLFDETNQKSKNQSFDSNVLDTSKNFFQKITNQAKNTYQKIKRKTISFFRDHFSNNSLSKINHNHVKKNKKNQFVIPLIEYIKQLKRTIATSKAFISSIIEKIRNHGEIKIIKRSNHNSDNLGYQSLLPELITIITKTPKSRDDNFYSDEFNETIDLEQRKNIDINFKNRMNSSVQKSYYNEFFNDNTNKHEWKVSDQLNSSHNINFTTQKFQEKYESLKLSNQLEESFMLDSNPCVFLVNNHVIPMDSQKKMMEQFKKNIPDIETQRLISTYANEKILHQSYLQLLSEHPEISQYQFNNSRNIYTISYLNDGSIKLVATHIANLDIKNNNSITQYKSCGIRATIILSPNHLPIMKYSHFLE